MKEAKNELMQFVAGIIMLVVGLYIFSQKVIVFSGFFSFGGGRFSSGLIVVPLIMDVCQRCEFRLKGIYSISGDYNNCISCYDN